MTDIRVPMDAVLSAFGLPATVRRPAPDDEEIEASVVWVTPLADGLPVGMDLKRSERRRTAMFSRDEVPTLPKRTLFEAAERDGDDVKTWRVEETEFADSDHHRVIVVEEPA